MHLQEYCTEDFKMSKEFLMIAKNNNYTIQCKTSIGWVTIDIPEYRNGVSYRVIRKEEDK